MQTLVLGIGYQPVGRVPWEKAIVWVLARVVEVVDEYPVSAASWKGSHTGKSARLESARVVPDTGSSNLPPSAGPRRT